MKVADILSCLQMESLRRICKQRGLDAPRKKREIVTRLARSYRGDLSSVLFDSSKLDLIRVAEGLSADEMLDLPANWRMLRKSDLRKLILSNATSPASPISSLYSTTYSDDDVVLPLNIDMLRGDAKGATRTTLISAYYSTETLENLLHKCGDTKVIVNGLGGCRLKHQIEELEKLKRKLKKKNKRVEIRLAFSPGIFHSKLYLFETPTGSIVWIGSANATQAALGGEADGVHAHGRNEEVLLRLEPAPDSLLTYAKSAWKFAASLEDCFPEVNSLPAFFRTGKLYYKPYATLPVTYNPFQSLLEKLPTEERNKLPTLKVRHTTVEAGIVAFNIDEVRRPAHGAAATDSHKERAMFRKYAIETCYGYWVADFFIDKVEGDLKKVAHRKMQSLKELLGWLKDSGRDDVIQAYGEYLEDVREVMSDNVNLERVPKKIRAQAFGSFDGIKRRLDTLIRNLGRERWCDRFSRPYVSEYVPEIWEDNVARQGFEDSFFESLAEQSHKSKWPKAAGGLLHEIGVYSVEDSEKIREKFERKLDSCDSSGNSFSWSVRED